jgi:hypothetical protein
MAGHLMAGDQRQDGTGGPVTVDGMKVAVADPAGNDADQELSRIRLGLGQLFDLQRRAQLAQHRRTHVMSHVGCLSPVH